MLLVLLSVHVSEISFFFLTEQKEPTINFNWKNVVCITVKNQLNCNNKETEYFW